MSCYMDCEDNNERMEGFNIIDYEKWGNTMKGFIILDSGASCHMFNNNTLVINFRLVNNKSLDSMGPQNRQLD